MSAGVEPVTQAIDRSLRVPPGMLVKTGYVDVFRIRFPCRERMAVGDIDRAYQKRLQLGECSSWPPPVGRWEGKEFAVFDGRHEVLAAIALGLEHILVAWLEEDDSCCVDSKVSTRTMAD